MTNTKGVQIQNEICLIILFCLFNVSASSNITKMDGLTLSKIIKSQNEISQNRHVVSDSNTNDYKTDTSGFELVTILHSQISGNFKVWHLILIVFLTWICFLSILCLVINLLRKCMKRKMTVNCKQKRMNNIYINPQSSLSISSKNNDYEDTSVAELTGGAHTNLLHCFTLDEEDQSSIEERKFKFRKNQF